MAVGGRFGGYGGGCSFWFVLLLLLNVGAAVAVEAPRQLQDNTCRGYVDPCRCGVANDFCCTAINNAIVYSGCPKVCKQLVVYNYPNMTAACLKPGLSGCPKCMDCQCSRASLGRSPAHRIVFLVVWIVVSCLLVLGLF